MSFITGIQQIGIGAAHLRDSMLFYKEHFGMDVLVFDDVSEAALMTRYTGGQVHQRRAVLTLNMQGGGGFELWQFQSRTPEKPAVTIQYGDLGIFAARLKCRDVAAAHKQFSALPATSVSALVYDPSGAPHFWVTDPFGNTFNVVSGQHFFSSTRNIVSGVSGAVIGVTDIDKALPLYRDVLGIGEIVYDSTGTFNDHPNGISGHYRRMLLRKMPDGKGAFGKLLGETEIELVQCLDRSPAKIYDGRYWGDCGFIHLCFDVLNMDALKETAAAAGFPFTVDSKESFAMEAAAGRFCYLEDPNGTLIELVETHRVPILKKWGWYLNLKKRNLEKPLPDWMIKMLALSKVK